MLRTFLIVLVGYYFDIAPNFSTAMHMMYLSVTDLHIGELAGKAFFEAILVNKRTLMLLAACVAAMLFVSIKQERSQETLRAQICKKHFLVQALVFVVLFFSVLIFGVYGPGTDPADFYYMQF